MTLTLTGDIAASARLITVTGAVPADVVPGYSFRLDDEMLTFQTFDAGPRGALNAVNVQRWHVRRGEGGTVKASHSAGATVYAATDANVASTDTTPPNSFEGGGGASTLADVLSLGNDTGGLAIVNVVGGEDEEADVSRSATANGNGNALAKTTATANGDGNAETKINVTSVGGGNATADVHATATDGTANANHFATSATWRATANTFVSGDNNASANTTVITADGAAEVKGVAFASGTGTAVASLTADAGNDAHVVSIELAATSTGESITITGIPTSDPGVAGQIYSNGVPSAGVPKALMISGGTS